MPKTYKLRQETILTDEHIHHNLLNHNLNNSLNMCHKFILIHPIIRKKFIYYNNNCNRNTIGFNNAVFCIKKIKHTYKYNIKCIEIVKLK
jgi:hypothetical protein